MATIDQEMQTNFPSDKHRFVANLVFTANWIDAMFVEQLKPFGISPQQFNILRILRGYGDWMTMSNIKSRMVDKSPNATRLADKLLSKELVERKRSEKDRRIVYLSISKSGLKLLDQIPNELGTEATFFDNIDPKEARKMSDALDRLRT